MHFINRKRATARRLIEKVRKTARRILRSLDLSLALSITIPPIFTLKISLTRKARPRS